MAKSKKKDMAEEVTELSRFEIGGATIIKYSNGALAIQAAPVEISAEDLQAILGEEVEESEENEVSVADMRAALVESGLTKKAVKAMDDDEVAEAYSELETEDEDEDEDESDEDESDEDEEEVSIEDMKAALLESGMTKKDLKKLSDEEIEEAYSELEEEESDEDEDEDEDESDEDEEELSGEELSEMDFEELEEVCDDRDLETDPDDFEAEDIEKLRKAVAKELGITLPKAKKGKK